MVHEAGGTITSRWMLIDEVERRALPLLPSDPCYYLLNRTSGGFSASPANSLIDDFKKDPYRFRNNPAVLGYKDSAVRRFAHALAVLLRPLATSSPSVVLVPMPTSRAEGDVAYDDRLVRLCSIAAEEAGARSENVLHTIRTVPASHAGGTRRVEEIASNIACSAPSPGTSPLFLVLVDDVLTTGAHYAACRERLAALFPSCPVFMGAFLSIHRSSRVDYESLGIRYGG